MAEFSTLNGHFCTESSTLTAHLEAEVSTPWAQIDPVVGAPLNPNKQQEVSTPAPASNPS